MRVAVVGAGISGLVVAHLLQRQHDVVVYEAGEYAGGHTNTIRVDTADETHHVDTGFIVFNDRNYPHFQRLIDSLGVAWQPSNMSFSVSDGCDFEYSGSSVNGLFAKRAHLITPWFHRMIADLARFNRSARRLLEHPPGEGPSLGHWLEQQRFSKPFIDRLIVPQASAVWSADPQQMWNFPARFLVEFFDNHGMLGFTDRPGWRTVRGGSARYVEALTATWRGQLRLRTPVRAVRRHETGVVVKADGAEGEWFDQVVLATHSDQALRLLEDPAAVEHELLSAIPYQSNEAVLHTDTRMLPRRRRAWASWNFHLQDSSSPHTTVTYHMNRLQALRSREQFCVTLNCTDQITPEKIIRRIDYAHPVFTAAGVRAQQRVAEINGRNRTHFCGAYWGWGFHEDGVVSALRVAERLGGRL